MVNFPQSDGSSMKTVCESERSKCKIIVKIDDSGSVISSKSKYF